MPGFVVHLNLYRNQGSASNLLILLYFLETEMTRISLVAQPLTQILRDKSR